MTKKHKWIDSQEEAEKILKEISPFETAGYIEYQCLKGHRFYQNRNYLPKGFKCPLCNSRIQKRSK